MQEKSISQKNDKIRKIEKKDIQIVSYLRQNARDQITHISKKTSIPVSTICDRIRMHQGGLIKKHAALIDFKSVGYSMTAYIVIKCQKESRDGLREHLVKHFNVNTLSRINNGFDFFLEGIFRDITQMESFLDALQALGVIETKVHYVIDEIKREDFMTNPDFAGAIMDKMV